MQTKQIERVETYILEHDGKKITLEIPVTITCIWIGGYWEEAITGEEQRRIEGIIEKAWPGWYHVCFPDENGVRKVEKKDCQACQKNKLDKQNGVG